MLFVRWHLGSRQLLVMTSCISQRTVALLVRNRVKIDTSLASNICHMFRWRRDPFGALPWEDVLEIHGIDLFESAALAFDDEEVDDNCSHKVAGGKDITISIMIKLEKRYSCHEMRIVNIPEINGTGDEWGEETDTKVPDPVAGGGQSHTLGTIARGEDFGLDSPDHGTPGSGKAKNEETSKDDQNDTWRRSEARILEVKHEMAN